MAVSSALSPYISLYLPISPYISLYLTVLMAVSSVASEAVSRSKSSWVYTVKEPSSSGPPTWLGLGLGLGLGLALAISD